MQIFRHNVKRVKKFLLLSLRYSNKKNSDDKFRHDSNIRSIKIEFVYK